MTARYGGLIVDGHLDLAYNAMLGRDLTLTLEDLRAADPLSDVAAVTFGSLRRGHVGLCLGTIFTMPQNETHPWGYTDWRGAREQAVKQLDQYQRWQDSGHVRLLTGGQDVADFARTWSPETSPLGVVLLMEGADPLRDADDLPWWVERGLRVVGPAWQRTRYSGGTGAPGGLTDRGRELMVAMRELNVTLDASHMAEEAFWDALELHSKVVASHSNHREIMNRDRHVTAEMLRAIRERGGVAGVVIFNSFLQPGWQRGDDRIPLSRLQDMIEILARDVGWDRVVIGSDLDGGYGVLQMPLGLESAADLPRVADLLPEEHRDGVMGGNWLRWLSANL